jgi:hypothetical protein
VPSGPAMRSAISIATRASSGVSSMETIMLVS